MIQEMDQMTQEMERQNYQSNQSGYASSSKGSTAKLIQYRVWIQFLSQGLTIKEEWVTNLVSTIFCVYLWLVDL